MGDMIRDGMSWLAQQSKTHISRSVSYSRGSTSYTVSATIGRTERESYDQNGASILAVSRAYLILVDDLVLIPCKGDRITDSGEVYEVLPAAGEDSYRASDAHGIRWRIHTKRISA